MAVCCSSTRASAAMGLIRAAGPATRREMSRAARRSGSVRFDRAREESFRIVMSPHRDSCSCKRSRAVGRGRASAPPTQRRKKLHMFALHFKSLYLNGLRNL